MICEIEHQEEQQMPEDEKEEFVANVNEFRDLQSIINTMDDYISDLENELAYKEDALRNLQEQVLTALKQNSQQREELQTAQNSVNEQTKRNKELEEQYQALTQNIKTVQEERDKLLQAQQ